MEEIPEPTVFPSEIPNVPIPSIEPIPLIPNEPTRFTVSLVKTNGPG